MGENVEDNEYHYDYEAAYKEIDEHFRTVVKRECSEEMMVVHRMYLRLDDIDAGHLPNPEGVKIMLVYADVVDVESERLEFAGRFEVYIMCRLLRVKARHGSTLDFKYFTPVGACMSILQLPAWTMDEQLHIWAQQLMGGESEQELAIRAEFWAYEETTRVQVVGEWQVKPYGRECTKDESVVRTCQTLQKPGFTYRPDESDFQEAQIEVEDLICTRPRWFKECFHLVSPEPISVNWSDELCETIEGAFSSLELALSRTCVIPSAAFLHLQWLTRHLAQMRSTTSVSSTTSAIINRLELLLSHAKALLNTVTYLKLHTRIIGEVVYAEVYKNVRRAFSTRECSELMTMQRMYFLLDDLDAGLFKNPQVVKELIVYADIVEIGSTTLRISGSTRVIIMCRLLSLKRSQEFSPFILNFPHISHDHTSSCLSLYVSPAMLLNQLPTSGVYIYAQELIMCNPFNPTTCFSTSFQSSIPVEILGDSNVLPLIQAALHSLTYQLSATANVKTAQDHLQWLITHLAQVRLCHGMQEENKTNLHESSLNDLRDLLLYAQLLLKMSNESESVIVPSLRYEKYSKLIERMATAASDYNSQFLQVDYFIRQNQITGDYLLQQNKIFIEKERDVEYFHSLLTECKKTELDAAISKMKNLKEQLTTQEAEMNQAKKDMHTGLIANAVFTLFEAVFELGLVASTLANAATTLRRFKEVVDKAKKAKDTLEEILKMVKMVENICSYFDALMDVYTLDIEKLQQGRVMPKMPSKADWEIFENELTAVAENMPLEISQVPIWKAKCKNVASVFRELITTASYMKQLEYDILVEDMEAKIAAKQAERLDMTLANLKNYEEMAMQLEMRTTRILSRLLKALKVQSGALLYHYLLPPRSITNWMDMDAVTNALLSYEELAVEGLEQLGTPTDYRREYVVADIPIALLMNGQDWIFTIPIDDYLVFPAHWSAVRIQYVEMRFNEGHYLPSTSSGQVYFLLQASRMFQDRKKGEVLNYEAAIPLDYQFAYELETGHPTVTNKPTYEYKGTFMRMTPFTQWRLRLSASAHENQGLSFPTAREANSTTQISITFYLTAIREKSI